MNSHQIEDFSLHSPPESEWPYSTPISAAYPSTMPRITTDPDQYALGTGSILTSPSGGPYSMQLPTRGQSFDNSPYSTSLPRQSFSTQYHTGTQYGSQPPRHGLPIQISQPPTTSYSTADFSPPWNSLSTNTRSSSTTYAFQTEIPSSYQSTVIPYLPNGGLSFSAGSTEPSSMFPGLSPLASSLPYSGPNRVPNPASTHSLLQNDDNGLSTYLPQVTDRGSISTAPRDIIQASESSSSTASSSPSETNYRGSNAGYGNLNCSPQGRTPTGTSGCPCGDHPSRITDDGSYTTANPNSGIGAFQQGSHRLPNINLPYGVQTMHTGFGILGNSVNPMASGGSLSDGSQLPPSIHHPQPQHSNSHDMPPVLRSMLNTKPRETQKRADPKAKGQPPQRKR